MDFGDIFSLISQIHEVFQVRQLIKLSLSLQDEGLKVFSFILNFSHGALHICLLGLKLLHKLLYILLLLQMVLQVIVLLL